MTEREGALIQNLIAAALPLPWQAALGVLLVAGVWVWALSPYGAKKSSDDQRRDNCVIPHH